MKKTVAFIIALVILSLAACGFANTNYRWDIRQINLHFPQSVIQDVSDMCSLYRGTEIGKLGLVCDQGSNFRSLPATNGYDTGYDIEHPTIMVKLHKYETVYVYFSFYENGDEWYYAVLSDGTPGFLFAKRVMLYNN